jgi:hypothetical protein
VQKVRRVHHFRRSLTSRCDKIADNRTNTQHLTHTLDTAAAVPSVTGDEEWRNKRQILINDQKLLPTPRHELLRNRFRESSTGATTTWR